MNSKFFFGYLRVYRDLFIYSASIVGAAQFLFYYLNKSGVTFTTGSYVNDPKTEKHAILLDDYLIAVADGNNNCNKPPFPKFWCNQLELSYKEAFENVRKPIEFLKATDVFSKDYGSGSICLLTLDYKSLNAVYMGDSRYGLFRKNQDTQQYEIISQSQGNFKEPNISYQVGLDSPEFAVQEKLCVQENDLIVVGTGSLFKNISFEQIRMLFDKKLGQDPHLEPGNLAKLIAEEANRSVNQISFSKENLRVIVAQLKQ